MNATSNNATGPTPNKQVIYVDIDDEITTIIDKMNAADAKLIALVLPKRAAVFQSVVNMKLLKRRAEAAKKHLVLITSESGLMPLAGLAGIHVAPTLTSKPEIPATAPQANDDDDEETATMATDDFDRSQNAAIPVGALAGAAATSSVATPVSDAGEVIMFDNTAKAKKSPPVASNAGVSSTPKDKKLKIPNFFSFRKRILLAGLALILLVGAWYVAYFIMPKATIVVRTNSSDIDSRFTMTLDTAITEPNTKQLAVPAQTKQEQKSNTQQAPATGQENKGEKADGAVRMTAQACAPSLQTPGDIPAGTGVSYNGNTYISQSAAKFAFDGAAGSCVNYKAIADTPIVATKAGIASNTGGVVTFTVAGGASAKGSAEGGTDNIVKVVQQADIDAAQQKLTAAQDQNAIKRQLQQRLEDDDLYALATTFFAGTPNTTTSSNVGEEAETVTVTQSVTYTMFGAKADDLKQIINSTLEGKIDKSKQSILDDGLAKARITIETPSAGPELKLGVFLTAVAGPKLDAEDLKQAITGLKSGEVKDRIKAYPGVEEAEVKYSPFWVTKAPKPEKITLQFEKSATSEAADGTDTDTAGQ